ncbi:CapA family protein [Rhodococcus sp. NPDC127528]|uniref:CapA family protein n=1 Tax=unclassified Rhodococcus (in: high G+C Gram-positive bacteria) TaxID=192944 RepID=UPI0036454B12
MPSTVALFLAGDVMTGRGVDQILPHPGSPLLRERLVRDARDYVALAERRNGPIPRPVGFERPWGVALSVLDDAGPDARIVNLETSVTTSRNYAPGKGIHYRMHPANVGVLGVAQIDVCALANNHVLDFGRRGLIETVDVLESAGLRPTGAGHDDARAWAPATVPVGSGRVLVYSMGSASSGLSRRSGAGPRRPGVALLPNLSDATAARVLDRIAAVRGPDDLVVVSVHWGSNWGYDVPRDQERFAHRLVDGGVDVVHGHSSHHPRPVEIHHGRPVLYGCGDLINDYEGIGGYEEFRDELRLLYLPVFAADTRELRELRMVPVRARRMRLEHATLEEARWLRVTLGVGDSAKDVAWISS